VVPKVAKEDRVLAMLRELTGVLRRWGRGAAGMRELADVLTRAEQVVTDSEARV